MSNFVLRLAPALCLLAVCAGTASRAQSVWDQPAAGSQPSQGGFQSGFVRPAAPSPWANAPGTPQQPSAFDQPAQPLQSQEPPCIKDFIPLRDDAEKKAQAVRSASKRKATPQEACRLFTALVTAQEKLAKFAAANVASCGIPKEVPEQIKKGVVQTTQIRTRVCEIAARGPARTGPSLSDSLGASTVPNATNVRRGGGTYDTLSGSALGR